MAIICTFTLQRYYKKSECANKFFLFFHLPDFANVTSGGKACFSGRAESEISKNIANMQKKRTKSHKNLRICEKSSTFAG